MGPTGRDRRKPGREPAPGRLRTRPPATPPDGTAPTGLQKLQLGAREALLHVPAGYRPDRPAPLVLMLHGAGGEARHGIQLLAGLADDVGFLLLAPASEGRTWDVILGSYGPDVTHIDQALEQVFARYAVAPSHLAVGGFSDGASYALSLGLANGDLFTHIVAFSPGFMAPATLEGRPRIYVSHGTHDEVLPVDACSRRLVPELRRTGYDVRYHEFDGPHTVPPGVAREAINWLTAAEPAAPRRPAAGR